VGPRAGLDMMSKRKIPSPRRKLNPDRLARNQPLFQTKIFYVFLISPMRATCPDHLILQLNRQFAVSVVFRANRDFLFTNISC
jgi:hypothetical protein